MADNTGTEITDKDLFTNLIMMLSSSAMQQLGKIANPITQKTEVNLEGAQITIDMLTMIQKKTAGNLESDEKKMLNDIISSLQMTYVDASKTQMASTPPEKEESKPGHPTDEQNSDLAKPFQEKSEQKKTRYHKSYGES